LPQYIVCHRCSFVLYKGNDFVSPEEIVKRYGGRCPRCLASLSFSPVKVEINEGGGNRRGRKALK